MAAGIWTGLYEGYKDRKEYNLKRETFLGEQSEKRTSLLLELMKRRGQSGVTGTDGESGGSAEHYMKVMKGLGASDDVIANLAAGGVTTLKKASEEGLKLREAWGDQLNPTMLDDFFSSAVVTVSRGEEVDWREIADSQGWEVSDEDALLLDSAAVPQTSAQVDFVSPPPSKPLEMEDYTRTTQAADADVMAVVEAKKLDIDNEISTLSRAPGNEERLEELAKESARLQTIITNKGVGANEYAGEALSTYIEAQPELLNNPGLFGGPRNKALQDFLTKSGRIFNTEEEVRAAYNQGTIQPGMVINYQGQLGVFRNQ